MDKQPQSSCAGLLVFEAAGGYKYQSINTYKSKCYGVTSSVESDLVVDLTEHHYSRTGIPSQADAALISFTCLGKAMYQHGPSNGRGETPPPFCLGVEFLRYGQIMQQHRQAAAALPAATAAAHHQAIPMNRDAAMPSPTDIAHTAQLAPSSYQHASTSSSADAATAPSTSYHSAQHQQHEAIASSKLAAQAAAAHRQRQQQQEEQQEQLSFFERLERTRNEVNERLEGKDPLWFGKAFAHRASLNWESMKRMAGDLAAAAKADLGFQENDETE